MPGVFPEVENGAVIVRGLDGVCTGTLEAPNAYCPPATFTSTCAITALSEDCVSRIKPSQINALVSEILCLANMLTPEGSWDCASNCNLAAAFEAWQTQFVADFVIPVDDITIEGGTNSLDPIRLIPEGAAASVVSTLASRGELLDWISTDPTNILTFDAQNRILASASSVVADICADTTRMNLAACLLLPAPDNLLDYYAPTGQLYVSPSQVATGVCADPTAPGILAACLRSTDASNGITIGTDGKLFALSDTSLSPDFVQGGILSLNAGTPLTALDIAPFKQKAGALVAILNATITKNINGTWVPGTGGGLANGVKAAATTYFVYGLRKISDGSGDVVFSTSPTVAGVVTTLLAGYTVMEKIGVFRTDPSTINIVPFVMHGDEYTLCPPINDFVNVAVSTTAALIVLAVPAGTGIAVKANLRFMYTSGATTAGYLIHEVAQGNLVAGGGNAGSNAGTIQTGGGFAVGADEIWTNNTGQVRHVAGASGSVNIWLDGYTFPCKRIP